MTTNESAPQPLPVEGQRCADCKHRKSAHHDAGDLEWCAACPDSQEGCLGYVAAPYYLGAVESEGEAK